MGEGCRGESVKVIVLTLGLPRIVSTTAPMIIRMVWMKSVQMTAVRPPAMVKRQAMARRIRMDR